MNGHTVSEKCIRVVLLGDIHSQRSKETIICTLPFTENKFFFRRKEN
jgi:hypothetical protein